MDSKTLLLLGAAGVGAYLLFSNNSATPVLSTASILPPVPVPNTGTALSLSTVTPTIPGAPPAPAFYNDVYYKTYQYPELVAMYPNLRNPQYQLTDQDATNYLNNYLELQQWLPNAVDSKGKKYPSNKAALQYHWSTYGVPYGYSFIPFTPPKNSTWTPPPAAPKAASSGGFLSDALKVVTTVAPVLVALAGPNDNTLNYADVELVVTSAGIIKQILPFYLQSDKSLVNSINNRIDQLLTQYES